MTSLNARTDILEAAHEAHAAGLSWSRIAAETGLSASTLQRWRQPENTGDQRPHAERPVPENALSEAEKELILETCNKPEYASLPPAQIVAKLADEGSYIGSESTFYRILRVMKQQHHRGRARAPSPKRPPATHTATAPNQIWVWDITWLPAKIFGTFYKLYIIMDLFSRKIITAEVFDTENAEYSKTMVQRAYIQEGGGPEILHGDNGSPLKEHTLIAKLQSLGIKPSHSRPRVSNDNAHAEALFRTLKYTPAYPAEGFDSIEEARKWTEQFVQFYNHEHLHSGIGMVSPAAKHAGEDIAILQKRKAVYEKAKAKNPSRWIQGKTRALANVSATSLNPIDLRKLEKDLKNIKVA